MTRRMSWPMAAVLVAGVMIAAAAAPIYFVVYRTTRATEAAIAAPERAAVAVADKLAQAVRPRIDIKNVTLSTIASMRKKSKLVVLDTTIDLDVTRDESYSAMGFVYLGTNRVRLIARENRIQYVIGLDKASSKDFAYDEAIRKLTIYVDRPRLDEEMVSVQSDPAKCYAVEYKGGWMRFDLRETLKHTQEMLRPALIERGRSEIVSNEADRAGILAVRTFVEPLVGVLREDGVTVEVAYR